MRLNSSYASGRGEENSPAPQFLPCRGLEFVSEFWQVTLGQQCCPSLVDTIARGHRRDGKAMSARETAAGDGALRAAVDERLRHAQKFGWREGCLLDIVSLRAAAPVSCGAKGSAPAGLARRGGGNEWARRGWIRSRRCRRGATLPARGEASRTPSNPSRHFGTNLGTNLRTRLGTPRTPAFRLREGFTIRRSARLPAASASLPISRGASPTRSSRKR